MAVITIQEQPEHMPPGVAIFWDGAQAYQRMPSSTVASNFFFSAVSEDCSAHSSRAVLLQEFHYPVMSLPAASCAAQADGVRGAFALKLVMSSLDCLH